MLYTKLSLSNSLSLFSLPQPLPLPLPLPLSLYSSPPLHLSTSSKWLLGGWDTNCSWIQSKLYGRVINYAYPAWHKCFPWEISVISTLTQIGKFMGPTWGPPGSCRPQMGPVLVPWTLLSGLRFTEAMMRKKSVHVCPLYCPANCSLSSKHNEASTKLPTFLMRFPKLKWLYSLQWRHKGHDVVSDHQPHHCLLNCLFRRRSKKISKLRVTGLCVGNSPVTGFHLMTSSCLIEFAMCSLLSN